MYARAINVRTLLIAAAVAMLVLVGAGVAYATGGESSEQQATGPGIAKAKSVALEHTNGGGRVSGTEIGDEEGYYEIEVTLADGSQVDVHLDRDFNVLSTPADTESPGEKDGPNGSGG